MKNGSPDTGQEALHRVEANLPLAVDGETEEGKQAEEAFFYRYDEKLLSGMRQAYQKRQRHQRLMRFGNIAAVMLGVLLVGFGTAVAVSPSFRSSLIHLAVWDAGDYTSIEIRTTEQPEEEAYNPTLQKTAPVVPEEWGGSFFPSFIPQGLAVGHHDSFSSEYAITYVNPQDGTWQLHFVEIHDSPYGEKRIQLDTEGAAVETMWLDGRMVTIFQQAGTTACYWTEDDALLILSVHGLSMYDLLACVNSIQRIR